MNCKKFWEIFEESGLTPELERHLESCAGCREEMKMEELLKRGIDALPGIEAPEHLWDTVGGAVSGASSGQPPAAESAGMSVPGKIKALARTVFPEGKPLALRPVLAGIALALLIAAPVAYQFIITPSSQEKIQLQMQAIAEVEETEKQYLAAIENLSGIVNEKKESIDPDLYRGYEEKLAVLDEYIRQCREAIELNEYNISARQHLFMAYKEKVATLKKMAETS